ncbi:3-hydroxyisobutyrate dehydrogenase [Magnetococcus marinus MC-1]|uniref:3-hydroxyisobutyrate dehydrogenase n=1 Tax=Magnetococcus marinus (strain ATCC BAA-1437 / JCM 17883 / MC-1) TaxID=156889 RepID=A0LDJ3_MAGMM|nr:NAD(P)-dependent oxidoreductase [Magnetococcus marinus]ABK46036.1 3-hydroxyisobutyrate dehydrogenase [Magnetococcus marinus MC-1]
MQKIGFIGLGIMGSAMANSCHHAGYQLCVYNRGHARLKPFIDRSIPTAATPQALATQSDYMVIMVSDPAALLEVLQGPVGVCSADLTGKVVINASTVSVEASQQAATLVEQVGGAFLDAPVSGSKIPAQTGKLVFLAGGHHAVIQRCEPLLLSMGSAVIPCGAVGDGTRMKLAMNLLMSGMVQALAESLLLVRNSGLEDQLFMDAIKNSVLFAPILGMKGQAFLNRDFEPHFPLHLLYKDLNLIHAQALEHHVALPAGDAIRQGYAQAMQQGLGGLDIAAILQVLEKGIDTP